MVLMPLTSAIYQLLSNVQLIGSRTFDSHILMYSCTPKNDVSMAKESQKYLSKDDRKHGVIDQEKYRKRSSLKKMDRQRVSCLV